MRLERGRHAFWEATRRCVRGGVLLTFEVIGM